MQEWARRGRGILWLAVLLWTTVGSEGSAQVWEFDANSPVIILNEALADIASDGMCPASYGDWGLPNVRDIGPGGNICFPNPEEAIVDGVLISGYVADRLLLPCFTAGVNSVYPYGADDDLFTTDAAVCGFPQCHTTCTPVGLIGIKGSGTRTLQIDWRSTSTITSLNDEHFSRTFDSLLTTITATILRVGPGTIMGVSYSWKVSLSARPQHEAPNPPLEDPVQAEGSLAFDLDGAGPGLVFSNFANGDIGPDLRIDSGEGVIPISNFGTPTLTVNLGAFSRAELVMDPGAAPPDLTEGATSQACGTLKLTINARTFVTPNGEPMSSYMRCIPPGGNGTGYTFGMGRHEITNAQFSDFLNLAEFDGGATEVGGFLAFDAATGDVSTTGGVPVLVTQNTDLSSRIIYDPSAPLGSRYSVEPLYENHSVVNLTQIGAMKFCNWLTLDQGYGIGERCYTEGANLYDWHPVSISQADWLARELNDSERQDLTDNYLGFRLPMDNLGNVVGAIGAQENLFNEWYQAAAYDPAAPDTDRGGPNGETVSADHWMFGHGRDLLTIVPAGSQLANWSGSGDPFDDDDTPVGFYDGTTYNPGGGGSVGNGNEAITLNTANPYALYDMSGNVWEYAQDKIAPAAIDGPAVRSGAWTSSSATTAATYRLKVPFGSYASDVGFRVVRCDTSSTAWPPQAACPPQSGSPTTLAFRIVGGSSGIGWSWCIEGTGFSVCDLLVPGVPTGGTATDLAVQWVNSINSSGCPGISATQSGDIFSLTVPGTFSLCVGPYGGPATCCMPPTTSCPFNPIIQLMSGTCACDCHADPACDGVTTILDVVETVNAAFRNDPADPDPNPSCPYETTDTDCNGFTDIIDVSHVVNVAFRNGNPATEFCNPCP